MQLPITCQMKISLDGQVWGGLVRAFLEKECHYTDATITKRMVVKRIQYIEVLRGGIVNQRVTDSWKIPQERQVFGNENRRSIKLRLHIKRHMDLEMKNAEYC